jgi:sulfur-oxidizing protein SoxY
MTEILMSNIGPSFSRRLVLQGAGSVALIGLGFGTMPALAAANDKYPEDAFKQKSDADAIKALYGKTAEASDKVKLDAPEIAENGAVVPIAVATTLTDVTVPAVANRLKMAKTCNVIAIVESDGKLFSATKEVKVTVGGCGG